MNNDNSADQIFVKKSIEVRSLGMDFTNWIKKTVTISNPIVEAKLIGGEGEDDLTFASPTVSGKVVYFIVSGGVKNKTYTISVTIETSDGQTLSGDGSLRILDE